MAKTRTAALAALSLMVLSSASEAGAINVSFEFDEGYVAYGSFSYDGAKQGLLGFSDLTSFLYVDPLDSCDLKFVTSGSFNKFYYYLGFDASSQTFVTKDDGVYPQILTAIKQDGKSGFYSGTDYNKVVTTYGPYQNYEYSDFTYSVDGTSVPSPVPLPAAAPMFGAAVLALSLLGCGLRNRKRAATA